MQNTEKKESQANESKALKSTANGTSENDLNKIREDEAFRYSQEMLHAHEALEESSN